MTRRRWIVAAAVFLVAPVLAGCSAGFDANTNKPYAPNEAGVLFDQAKNYGMHGIQIPQAFILGPDSGAQLAWRGSAPVYLNVLNTNGAPDTLTAVSAGTMATAKVAAPIQLPSNQLVNTGKPSPQIMLEGLSKALRGGESIRLDLQFANAGVVSMDVPVVTRSREFKDYPPAPNATAAPTPSPSASAETTEAAH
ncbi:copper chaperone PCu(A)C [Nonomuraea guangzhouensis]|uniref:Copper chaperone PCu(A)C n=1 Tax=Nonomuraea guangzhouensis TaxID=1291555 RepID=A0ABW4G3W0_9ACTN|nr:copper chaperone PCu(A)C [Nonomuraea guangzhouensis]